MKKTKINLIFPIVLALLLSLTACGEDMGDVMNLLNQLDKLQDSLNDGTDNDSDGDNSETNNDSENNNSENNNDSDNSNSSQNNNNSENDNSENNNNSENNYNSENNNSSQNHKYVAGAWIKDNVRISFYQYYREHEDNTKKVVYVYGNRAMMEAIDADGIVTARTLYIQTEKGVTAESLLIPGVAESYYSYETEGMTLKEFLPKVFDILATFETRAQSEIDLKEMDNEGSDIVAGRACTKYGQGTSLIRQYYWVDNEFGILLKSEVVSKKDNETQTSNFWVVEAMEFDVLGPNSIPQTVLEDSNVAQSNNSERDPYELWMPLVGYWHASDGRFFQLDMADSYSISFEEGIWASDFRRNGYLSDFKLSGTHEHSGTVTYNKTSEEHPEKTSSVIIDWSNLDNDGKIRITVDENSYYCAYAGSTEKEAFDTYAQNIS